MTKKRLAQILRMASENHYAYGVCHTLRNLNCVNLISEKERAHTSIFLKEYFANPKIYFNTGYWLNQKPSVDVDGAAYRKQLLLDAADFVEVTGIVE